MKRVSLSLTSMLALFAALGCGPQFDPSSEVTTLRVLGVKKDKPYAQPGDKVSLQLLWHDAKSDPETPRRVETVFIDGCVNPPGDLYYGCFAQYAEAAAEGRLPRVAFDTDTFDVTLPSDIISSRENEPGQSRYGLDIVFFGVCAGTLDVVMTPPSSDGSSGLPIRCLDGDGQPLGSDDFVFGYTSIYSFADASNENPAFTPVDRGGEFLVAGKSVPPDCLGEECQGAPDVEVDCDATPERCIALCEDDGDAECPEIEIAPLLPAEAEEDSVNTKLFGSRVTEQMWINYYVDRGGISEVKLLNDSTTGWNDEYRGELRAPKEPGPLKVWAVAHDNRGGMDFARVTLRVQ